MTRVLLALLSIVTVTAAAQLRPAPAAPLVIVHFLDGEEVRVQGPMGTDSYGYFLASMINRPTGPQKALQWC